MKKNLTIKIPNPIFWVYNIIHRYHERYHVCNFENKLYDISMENNTNYIITQCRCGKTNMDHVHRKSERYKDWIK